jgi:predicted DsbA family dithiol-disulfide isomerase
VTSFDLSYDYRCPFAKNIHLHAITAIRAGADFSVNFVPWTMSQGYKTPSAPDVWDDPARDAEHLSLAVSTSIRDLQPEHFLDAHEALFRARHEHSIRLVTLEEIDAVLVPLGVDMGLVRDDLDSRRPHKVIGESFREFEHYEAFGVPTFVVDGDATFVRYMTVPGDDAGQSIKVIESIITLIALEPELNEFKHTRVQR